MATFLTAYKNYILPAEGGYANVKEDKGGETYAGIARNFHPNWEGWPFIDKIKATRVIKRNEKFPELTPKVEAFYLNVWSKNNFDKIINQDVSNILFDWYINSGSNAVNTRGVETYGIDEILNRDFGFSLPIDSKFDSETIKAINSVDPVKLYTIIKEERRKFYEVLIKNNPSQQVFAAGWFSRIAKFPDLVGGTGVFLSLILVVIVLVILTLK